MSSFRFIHTADIHLDSPLRGLPEHDGQMAERIRRATRGAFESLVGTAIDEGVDFVVIAGDLYDGDWRDYRTGLFFVAQMGRLRQADIPVFLLYGNHDAESAITKRLHLPDNVRVFGARKPETLLLESLSVALHGQSFGTRAVMENLAAGYPAPRPGRFNVGVLHTALGGRPGHEPYAPCSLDELVNKGYDYWALGHVHHGEILHERPHVVFPGNLQGRHIREIGEKGACLVTVEDGQVADVARRAVDVVRWAQVTIDVSSCADLGSVVGQVRAGLEGAVADVPADRLLAVRLRLTGRSPAHHVLCASRAQLLAECWGAALGFGEECLWIERVVIDTMPVGATVGAVQEAVGELAQMLEEAKADPALVAAVEADVREFVGKLPAEVRREVENPLLQAALGGQTDPLLDGGREYLLL
ncbi:MAG: metallophosphoesterase family protein [Steroidobacteraceae bacterium]